MTKSYVGLTKK